MREERSTLAIVAPLVAIMAFYLYFAGWTFSTELRARFGLQPTAIETPVYFYIVYAYDVFFRTDLEWPIFGWPLFLGLAGSWYAVARVRFIPLAEAVIVIVLATVPFPLISALAAARANTNYSFLRSGGAKPVELLLRGSMNETALDGAIQASKEKRLWLLFHTD